MLKRKLAPNEVAEVENLIKTTLENPIDPGTFIPWSTPPSNEYEFIPQNLFSLYGHELYDTLTPEQKKEFAKAEVGQVMYSYSWSEALACLFFYRYLASFKENTSVEYRYLLIEIFEETCHQQMFSKAIQTLNVEPIPANLLHRIVSWLSSRFSSPDIVFMSVLAVELVADMYGQEIRKQKNMYPVLAKISELHEIEENRHMYFGELLLKRYTENAGLFRRSLYSIVVCFNLYFMRTLYVRKEIFQKIGLDPKIYFKPSYDGLKVKFAEHCMGAAKEFVSGWNGFNWITKIFWKVLLDAKF